MDDVASNIVRALRWGYECSNRNNTCYTITSKRFTATLFGGATASESCDAVYGRGVHCSTFQLNVSAFGGTRGT